MMERGVVIWRHTVVLAMLVALSACGRSAPAQSIVPTVTPVHDPPLRTLLVGVWEADTPPIELTFDLDFERVTIEHKGLPIRQIWRLVADHEDADSVFLRGPRTSGGGAITVRFLADDRVQWDSPTMESPWVLTRK